MTRLAFWIDYQAFDPCLGVHCSSLIVSIASGPQLLLASALVSTLTKYVQL
jgi:hypothetical protein